MNSPTLTAHLAAVRARLYRALIGLDEQTLTTCPLAGDLTGQQVLVHLAHQDRLDAADLRRLRMAQAGTSFSRSSPRQPPVDPSSLDAAVLAAQRARAVLLARLNALPARALPRPVRAQSEGRADQTTLIAWFQRRLNHETTLIHAIDAARPERPLAASVGPKRLLRAALAAAQADLHATLALLPAADRACRPLLGAWTARDLAGHLADWDVLFIHWCQTLLGRRSSEPYFDEDGDALTAHLAAQRQAQSWSTAWADAQANRTAFLRVVARTPEPALLQPRPGGSFPTAYHCAWSALEHVLHHAADLRAARSPTHPFPAFLLHFQGPYT